MCGNLQWNWVCLRPVLQGMAMAVCCIVPIVPLVNAKAAEATASDVAALDSQPAETFREETIYIPYTKLRQVFEREGRGVFLPYGEFEKLWKAARDITGKPTPVQAPVPFLISEADNEATVAREVVQVKARIKIELLSPGWHHIPLGLADAAVTRAVIREQPARILFDPQKGHELLIEKIGQNAESLTLSLEFAKAFEKAAGRNSVSFQSPRSPVNRWHIRIPESGVKVNITPLIAATEVPEQATTQPAGQTEILAFVGAAPVVQFDWTPISEGATGLATLATVQTEQQVRVDDGVVRTRTQLTYEISRAALAELLIEVPADQRVINVLDANVRQWSIVPPAASEPADGARQRIAIQLFEPVRTSQNIVLELEQFVDEVKQKKLRLPVVTAIGVGRQQGIVVVTVAEGLRADVSAHTGLQQIDASELSKSLSDISWLFAYRYAALPYTLTLQVDKVQPRIVADTLIEATVEPERLGLDALTVFTVERAGVFRFEFDLPVGYEIRQVVGKDAENAKAVQVDTYHPDGADKNHLIVSLSSKALGRVGLLIRLNRRLTESDLLAPTGKAVEVPIHLPRVSPATVEQATGRLVVKATENLRVNPGKNAGLRSVSFKEAMEGIAAIQKPAVDALRPVLAFMYAQEDVMLQLLAERRKPRITVGQVLLARVEAGVIKYSATFNYDIQYSGVSGLRIDVPADLALDIRNNSPGIREKVIDPPPKNLPPGYVAWSLVGETELTGNVQVRLSWERKIEELVVGKSLEVTLPYLRPEAIDRGWGQIVWTKTEILDVHETGEPKGVRPIDPQHDLMPGTSISDAARAFEFHDDWSLKIAITRYKLQEIKRTSIERAVLQMVVTRSNQISARALYRMRSANQRLAIKLPANLEFDSQPVRINGRTVALERGEQQDYYVPLVGVDTEKPFMLELRYSLPHGGRTFTPPIFPSEPAIQKVHLFVYLPEELAYLGSRGPWTNEIDWYWAPLLDMKPTARQSSGQLLNWVREGISTSNAGSDTFQTDGHEYLFSALRPSESGESTLRVAALSVNWLNGLVFVLVLVSGVVLLRFGVAVRYMFAGLLFVLLIFSGVFLPTFFRQILDGNLLAAVSIVLVLWLVQYLVWTRQHDPLVIARRQARRDLKMARIQAAAKLASPPISPPPASDQQEKAEGGEGHA